MVSVGRFFVLLVLCCCLQAVTPQMYPPRRNAMPMKYPMDGMGMMSGYAMNYPSPLSADERATLFVQLFECGTPGMPRCDAKYAASLVHFFHDVADDIEAKMQQLMRHSSMSMGPRSRTMTHQSRGLFGDRWGDFKGWFISKLND